MKTKMIIGVIFLLPLLLWTGVRIYKGVIFDINCTNRIKRAADSNTVELATVEMEAVIRYLETNNLTSGYTSVAYNSPDEDVGWWYSNLKSSLVELRKVTPQTTQLERSNVLIKLRESLLDHSKDGDKVTAPDGISIYPNNKAYAWRGYISLLLFAGGILLIIFGFRDRDRYRYR